SSTGTLQVFGNACTLKAHNCQRPKELFVFANDGECSECPKACTREYAPVCGVSAAGEYKVFGNECTFKSHNCENPTALFVFENKGNCCPKGCNKMYRPVCAASADGVRRVFGNECMLQVHNCEKPTEAFTLQSQGEC
ncbi:hypothetical protein BG000_001854, partial [Podila horticola]